MKTLKGTNCYSVYFEEKWEEGIGHVEHIKIICQNLENGGVQFTNEWK